MSPEEKLRIFLGLWTNENGIKTNKLNYFFLVQSILISVLSLNTTIGLQLIISLVGIIASFTLFFSIGRTVAFQQVWEHIIKEILEENKELNVRQLLAVLYRNVKFPLYGIIPSRYLVLFPPIFTVIIWIIMLAYQLIRILS